MHTGTANRRFRPLLALLWLLALWGGAVCADAAPAPVQWHSDSWPGLTDHPDALYAQLFRATFAQQGFALEQHLTPFKRSVMLVERGDTDFAGGIARDPTPGTRYYQAPFPVIHTEVQAFFHRDLLVEPWRGIASMRGRRVVSSYHLGPGIGLSECRELSTKAQAFAMVLKGRAEFYIDDRGELELTIQQHRDRHPEYDPDQFIIRPAGYASWYMISPYTARGRQVMEAYIRGTLALLEAGELERIYAAHRFEVPSELLRYAQRVRAGEPLFTRY